MTKVVYTLYIVLLKAHSVPVSLESVSDEHSHKLSFLLL